MKKKNFIFQDPQKGGDCYAGLELTRHGRQATPLGVSETKIRSYYKPATENGQRSVALLEKKLNQLCFVNRDLLTLVVNQAFPFESSQ